MRIKRARDYCNKGFYMTNVVLDGEPSSIKEWCYECPSGTYADKSNRDLHCKSCTTCLMSNNQQVDRICSTTADARCRCSDGFTEVQGRCKLALDFDGPRSSSLFEKNTSVYLTTDNSHSTVLLHPTLSNTDTETTSVPSTSPSTSSSVTETTSVPSTSPSTSSSVTDVDGPRSSSLFEKNTPVYLTTDNSHSTVLLHPTLSTTVTGNSTDNVRYGSNNDKGSTDGGIQQTPQGSSRLLQYENTSWSKLTTTELSESNNYSKGIEIHPMQTTASVAFYLGHIGVTNDMLIASIVVLVLIAAFIPTVVTISRRRRAVGKRHHFEMAEQRDLHVYEDPDILLSSRRSPDVDTVTVREEAVQVLSIADTALSPGVAPLSHHRTAQLGDYLLPCSVAAGVVTSARQRYQVAPTREISSANARCACQVARVAKALPTDISSQSNAASSFPGGSDLRMFSTPPSIGHAVGRRDAFKMITPGVGFGSNFDAYDAQKNTHKSGMGADVKSRILPSDNNPFPSGNENTLEESYADLIDGGYIYNVCSRACAISGTSESVVSSAILVGDIASLPLRLRSEDLLGADDNSQAELCIGLLDGGYIYHH